MQLITSLFALCVSMFAFGGCQSQGSAPTPAGQLPRNASVTVFPVLLGERPNPDVATVVGVLLERGGLRQVEVEPTAFAPDRSQDFAAQAAAFGTFVARRGVPTDYALFADFLGSPLGVTEVRGALVDKQGKVVWSDRQRPGEPAFDASKPGDPMDCSVLLVQQLRTPLHLEDPTRADAPEGKLAARMKTKAGVPPREEFAAMEQRLAALKQAGKPTIRVYPPRLGTDWSADGARTLAAAIEKTGLAHATAAAEPLRFAVEASSNQQQVLWSGAKSIQQAVRRARPQPDYLLFADFLMAGDAKAGAVHTFLLSPAGEFVVVDFQNSHHDDFQRVAPGSAAECCELAAIRLAGYLKP